MQDFVVNEVYSLPVAYHRSKVLVLGEPVKKTTAAAAASS